MMVAKAISLRMKAVFRWPRPELRQTVKERICIMSKNVYGMQVVLFTSVSA